MKTAFASLLSLATLAGCVGTEYAPAPRALTGVVIPVRDTRPSEKPERSAPPSSGPARPFAFPAIEWGKLATGLELATLPSRSLPLVQLRVVVLAGRSADGTRPGLAALTGLLLKDGGAGTMSSRELMTRVESLGATLAVDTTADRTVFGLAVTKDHMAAALDLLGTIVREPQMSPVELGKLKKREVGRLADLARTSGRWAASMMLWRDLFALPLDHHPYASFDALPAELENISAAECRAFHKRWYVPKNIVVVVAGDTTAEAAKAAVEKSFGALRGADPPVVSFIDPVPTSALKITLVDRPKSSQSDVLVGMLGPPRPDEGWAAFATANQVLGGGVAGRLFLDLRETRSLAYSTRSSLVELAHGPSLLVAYAGTQTAKTGLAVGALLEHVDRLGTSLPSDQESEVATRYLADVLAIRLETIGAVADQLVDQRTLGLPDDWLETYRKELGEVGPQAVATAAARHVRPGRAIVVVSGDADKIGPMLSRFGEVKVVDPKKGFARLRSIAHDPAAPLETEREAGR